MTETLVPEMVRSGFEPLRHALRPDRPQYTPDEARAIVDACVLQADILDLLQRKHDAALDRGMEGRAMAARVRLALGTVQDVLQAFADGRKAVADQTPPFEDRAEQLRLLEEARRRVERVRDEQQTILRWLDAPPPKVDPASLAGSASLADEDYADLDSVLGRPWEGEVVS